MHRAVQQPNGGYTFLFAPAAPAIAPTQSPQLPDCPPGGDRFRIAYRADNLEVHRLKLARGVIVGRSRRTLR